MIRIALPCGHLRPLENQFRQWTGQTEITLPLKTTVNCVECGAAFTLDFQAVAPKPAVKEELKKKGK